MKRRSKVVPFRRPSESDSQKAFRKRIEQTVAGLVEGELGRFADTLVTARALWRKYPELVTAETIPDYLCKAFKAVPICAQIDPNNPNIDYGTPVISRRQMREMRELARQWAEEEDRRAV